MMDSSSWSWRHRFYALLLRRALGPFLTPQSSADLHRSIQTINWSEGKFSLVDVELDPAHLTYFIQKGRKSDEGCGNNISGDSEPGKSYNDIAVYRARIHRFAIHLSICDIDSNKNGEGPSTARKATSAFLQSVFRSNDTVDDGESATGIALVAHVELGGFDIVLAPGRSPETRTETEWSIESQQHNKAHTPNHVHDLDASVPGIFSSLLDAAMKSLRFSLYVSEVHIRAYSQYCGASCLHNTAIIDGSTCEKVNGCWIALGLTSARYYDLIDSRNGETDASGTSSGKKRLDGGTNEKTVISKALDWEGIIVNTGESNVGGSNSNSSRPNPSLPVFQSSGCGKLRFCVLEKWSKSTAGAKATYLSTRQAITIFLGKCMAVEVDQTSLSRLIEISNAMTNSSEEDLDEVDSYTTWEDGSDFVQLACLEEPSANAQKIQSLGDEFRRETYDQIMKQYIEARHLARTRELRGGLLIPSFDERRDNNENIEGDVSFDAFFDANDHPVSYYCSLVNDNNPQGEHEEKGRKSHRNMEQTKIEIGLNEFIVKVHISRHCWGNTAPAVSTEQECEPEYVLLSLGDLQVIVFGSDEESKVNCSVSHFDVERQVANRHGTIINEPLLHFLDDSDGEHELLVPSPPCISMMTEFSVVGEEAQVCRVDVSLQPFEIIYQERALHCLSDVVAKFPQSETLVSEGGQKRKPTNIHFSLSSSSILLISPCQHDSKQMLRDEKRNSFFERHAYKDQGPGASNFLGIGLDLHNVTIELSWKSTNIDTMQTNSEESNAIMACNHVILFAKGTEIEHGRKNRKSNVPRRADLVAFTGDEESVMISYSSIVHQIPLSKQQTKRKVTFPIILPLSSTKTRQEMDESSDENNHLRDDAFKSKSSMSSDPQYILSSEANEASNELEVNIPSIFFDFTMAERQELSWILSNICWDDINSLQPSNNSSQPLANSTPSNQKNLLAIAFNVGQLSVVLHGSQSKDSNSYSLIVDKMQVHTLVGRSGARNIRVLCYDMTLYELSGYIPVLNIRTRNQDPLSCIERCELVQERQTKSPYTLARAIAFRQKLCQSLSPTTPALLIDVLLRGDEECSEMSIHINMYDMTHRYIMNSKWPKNLTDLIKSESTEEKSAKKYSTKKEDRVPQDDMGVEKSSSLINLFFNIVDCNMDYTPLQTFRNPSRVVFRMGDIQISSNIVMPPAAVQAYKLCLSDIRLHLCNYRHSYNEENTLLSCAHRYLSKDDLFVPERAKLLGSHVDGLDDALFRMNFVNLAVLDTLDAIISKSNYARNAHQHNDPVSTVALTFGKLSIYACHDSFSCLHQTYNEWFIKALALSEELENFRDLSENPLEANIGNRLSSAESECFLPLEQQLSPTPKSKAEIIAAPKDRKKSLINQASSNKPPALNQKHPCREDRVSLDLTNSLLFQNYYTLDAKTSRQAIGQHAGAHEFGARREGNHITLKTSSSDNWSTVEHGFLRHSKMPRERDQAAGWVLCDSSKSAKPAYKADRSSNQSEKVKVFPQHIPVKPKFDPFTEVTVDTAKLAGTEVPPDIGTRVIVKDGSVMIRLFDGFDWVSDSSQFYQRKEDKTTDHKKELLNNLIGRDDSKITLNIIPLPEDRNKSLQSGLARRKVRRNPHVYFQISLSGLKLKQDSFAQSRDHQLASCLDLSIHDFFIAETVSKGEPVKMMGEWMNESEHPRDDSDGLIMLRQVTNHPKLRVSSDGKLMSNESRATLELLPLRCYLNQNALQFVRNFFSAGPKELEEEDAQDVDGQNIMSDDEIIDVFFEAFKVRPCKLKVDYQPENMDMDSLRDGNYIEILNLCSLEEMILRLQPVEMKDLTGWGSVFCELASRWIEDICTTQAHKFLTRASPFQPFSNLGDPLADLAMVLVVPEGNVTDYFKGVIAGTTNFAGKVALEALSTSAKLTRFAANQLNSKALPSAGLERSLPRRPRSVPRHAGDTAGHAYKSVASGLREANYTIVTVPLREYRNCGAGGAARSALKGIPIGVIAPIAGASEALSYTLLGIRNQLRPDMRKEEEASLRGLTYD